MCHVTEWRTGGTAGSILGKLGRNPPKCDLQMAKKRGCGRLGGDLFNSNELLLKNEKHL